MGGCTPELLAETHGDRLRVFKLSGTGARAPTAGQDRAQAIAFWRDEKILDEHARSLSALERTLSSFGEVTSRERSVLKLSNLRHLMTRLDVRVCHETAETDILRAVAGHGATPARDGLHLLRRLEMEPRGPYYGLFGVISADGTMSFSQILRSVFRVGDRCYTMVGAAVTAMSDVDQELDETRIKLSNIFIREAA
jgi:yersiniabactin salicyl-AMP ligase